MKIKRKEEIKLNTLLEIIYEIYREDLKNGKIRSKTFKDCKQAVGKSAYENLTFQWPA